MGQQDLFAKTQSVLERLDATTRKRMSDADRAAMINAVAETYRLEGRDIDPLEIEQAVDQVLAEDEASSSRQRRKIPTHVWVLGALLAIPLIVPLLRLTEAVVALLLRLFI